VGVGKDGIRDSSAELLGDYFVGLSDPTIPKAGSWGFRVIGYEILFD